MEVDNLSRLKALLIRGGILALILYMDYGLKAMGAEFYERLLSVLVVLFVVAWIKFDYIRESYAHTQKQMGVNDLKSTCNRLLMFENRRLSKHEKKKRRNLIEKYHKQLEQLGRGYVYFIHEDGKGSVKIGKAKDPYGRYKQFFNIIVPWKSKFIHLVRSDNELRTERLFHDYFAKENISGEWFKLSERQINWIKNGIYTDEIAKAIADQEVRVFSWKRAFKDAFDSIKETRRRYRKVKRFFKMDNRRKLHMVRSIYRRK